MLKSLKDLEHYLVSATDGDIGTVDSFLFDGDSWVVRYLIVRTNGAIQGQEVVISPTSFLKIAEGALRFNVALTKERVKCSPPFDPLLPFSREFEGKLFQYYGYQPHWGFAGHWGPGAYPDPLATSKENAKLTGHSDGSTGVHLRNARELRGYHVVGTDEEIGHVEDFIVEDATWEVRYLVVDTSNWWFGEKVLVSPRWVKHISWEDKLVYVDMTRHAIQNSPPWKPALEVVREYESRLFQYYGVPHYWE